MALTRIEPMSKTSWKTYSDAQREEMFRQSTLLGAEDENSFCGSRRWLRGREPKVHSFGWGSSSPVSPRPVTRRIERAVAYEVVYLPAGQVSGSAMTRQVFLKCDLSPFGLSSKPYGQLITARIPPVHRVKPTDSQSEGGAQLSLFNWAWPTREYEPQPTEYLEEPEQPDPDALLAALANGNTTREQLRKTVLEAEVLSFGDHQIIRLKPLLRRYIAQYRDSDDPADIVAVASAIRKFISSLGREELSTIEFVLDAGHKAPVPPEIELEVAKMVVRKLSVILPQEADAMPELSSQLMDLARTYLNPRLLPRQHYGAIALNTVISLVLLRSSHVGELYGILSQLPVSWFRQLTVRRALSIGQDLANRFPEEVCRVHRESLESLVRVFGEASS